MFSTQTLTVSALKAGETITFAPASTHFAACALSKTVPAPIKISLASLNSAINSTAFGTVIVISNTLIRQFDRTSIAPNESAVLTFSTVVADSREKTLILADKYHEANAFELDEKLAWTRSQVELRHLGISTDEANLFQRLAGHLIYANEILHPRPRILKLNTGTQKDLWKYGIGGHLPLMVVRVGEGKFGFLTTETGAHDRRRKTLRETADFRLRTRRNAKRTAAAGGNLETELKRRRANHDVAALETIRSSEMVKYFEGNLAETGKRRLRLGAPRFQFISRTSSE